jgi:hypothetical protein
VVDCTACTGYTGQPNQTGTFACPDGCGTYTICYTPNGCSNYNLTECPGCSPTAGCQYPLMGGICTSGDAAYDYLGFCTGNVGACSFGSGASCLIVCLD